MEHAMNPTDPGKARQQILDDHREIGALLSQVAGADSAAATRDALQRLEPLLRHHFKEEEEELDGLHAAILQRAPQHGNALRNLGDEHRRLLELAGELRSKAADPAATETELRDLGQQLGQRLAAHETNETEIFVDSIWTDLGDGD
jgi:hemerythrin